MNKFTLMGMLCLVLATVATDDVSAQQQRKFVEQKPFMYRPRGYCNPQNNGVHPPYRSYDGTKNNLGHTKVEWGAVDIALYREIPAAYGATDPKNAMNGSNRPSGRAVSNAVSYEPVTTFNSRGLSSFVYIWGQFIDHDITLTPTANVESVPILLPATETLFTVPIPFTRSEVRAGTGVTNARQQSNLNTAWLDASLVYGCDSIRAKWLRTLVNGKLKTSAGNFLPWNTVDNQYTSAIDTTAPSMANDMDHTVKTFVAGDVRASEHPGLASLHTIFVREHNRICDRLLAQGYTNDELIYQKARKEVGAIIQAITYQEFLPAMGVTLSNYNGYRNYVRPDIMNTFATAGYRIGHTMVADDIMMIDNDCEETGLGEMDLMDAFWNPHIVLDYNIEPFLKGFATHTQYETDTKINSVLRDFLFNNPTDSIRFGIDLASLNIQRGRDHGLPDYNTVRKYYTGSKVYSFSQITSDPVIAAALQSLYGNVNNIDLWTGILAEDHLPGKSIGKTMYKMLKLQFENLRDGDYYFYKNDPYLSNTIRNQIKNTTLADVIERNSSITSLQYNVFYTEKCPGDTAEERLAVQPEINNAEFTIYPNPAKEVVNIDFKNQVEACTISIYNISGALVKQIQVDADTKTILIDISQLNAGIYMGSITSSSANRTFKLMKSQ